MMSQLSYACHLAAMLLLLAALAGGSGLPSLAGDSGLHSPAGGSGLPSPAGGSGLRSPAGSLLVPECHDNLGVLQTNCLKFVKKDGPKVPPSPQCCAAVKALPGKAVPCVCNYLASPTVRENISMEKVYFITKQCGVTIPGNSKTQSRHFDTVRALVPKI